MVNDHNAGTGVGTMNRAAMANDNKDLNSRATTKHGRWPVFNGKGI